MSGECDKCGEYCLDCNCPQECKSIIKYPAGENGEILTYDSTLGILWIPLSDEPDK